MSCLGLKKTEWARVQKLTNGHVHTFVQNSRLSAACMHVCFDTNTFSPFYRFII